MRVHSVLLILAIALISGVWCTGVPLVSNWQLVIDANGTVLVEDVDETYNESASTQATLEENVNFILYTRANTTGCDIGFLNKDTLNACNFNASMETRMIIHGWESYITGTMCSGMLDAYLEKSDCNVILVKWDTWACQNYVAARMKIAAIGQFVALVIDFLEIIGINLNDLIVVGHSLGAHIAGVACRNATNTVGNLIGLDPARPLFCGTTMNARMRSTDALHTQMFHTSAGWLGYKGDLAQVNFWLNGGSKQPGCGWDMIRTCAHSRSYKYMAESIATNNFTAYKCDSYSNFEAGNCANNETTYLGLAGDLGASSGDYYLDTNSASPYSQG